MSELPRITGKRYMWSPWQVWDMEGEEFMVKGDRNCQDREGAEGRGWGREKERETEFVR